MIQGVDHIHLMAPDIDITIDFYTRTLGFNLHRRIHRHLDDGTPFEVAYLRLGDMLVEVNKRGSAGPSTGAGNKPFGLVVDDMAGTLEDLRAKGVEIVLEPREAYTFGGLLAAIRDPNGVEIELKEYRGDGQLNEDWQPLRHGVVRVA